MKKAKRVICLLTAIICLVGAFSGCDSKNSKKTGSDGKVVISIVAQNDQPVDDNSRFVKEFERILGVDLDFVYLDRSKATELLNIRVASGEIPDIMASLSNDRFNAYLKQGVLGGIPVETFKEKAPTLYELTKKNAGKNAWDFATKDGMIYGIPKASISGKYNYVPIWRTDWLKNVGIDKIPETLEEAEEAFYKFVNDDPDGNGKKDTFALSDKGMSAVYGAFGGIPYESAGGSNAYTWTVKENGSVVATATLPGMKEALTYLHKWYEDGLIDPEFISGENKGGYWANTNTFWNGRIGFSVPGMAYHVAKPKYEGDPGSTHYQNFKELQGDKAEYELAAPFKGPDGHFGTESWGSFQGNMLGFGKFVEGDEAKIDKILEMYEKIVTDYDFNMYVRYGKEGEDYDYDPDKGVVWKSDVADSTERAKLGLMTCGIYNVPNNFEFDAKPKEAFYNYEAAHKYTDNYVDAVWGGLPSNDQYKAIIDKMIKENYSLFITGDRDIDEFDKFVKELNDAGLKQLTKEANEWYKKYFK